MDIVTIKLIKYNDIVLFRILRIAGYSRHIASVRVGGQKCGSRPGRLTPMSNARGNNTFNYYSNIIYLLTINLVLLKDDHFCIHAYFILLT